MMTAMTGFPIPARGKLAISDALVGVDPANGALLGDPIVRTTRTLRDLGGVFADEAARAAMSQEIVAYRVDCYFPVPQDTVGGLFFGATFLEAGRVGEEYFITKGHFHAKIDTAEYYWCIRGQGILLLMDEQRRCQAQRMKPGSLHYIPGRTAHRVANVGDQTLCFGACWPADAGHDYESIATYGFSARVLRIDGMPAVVDIDARGKNP
jgi:glucose-6-phosphate isomerase